MRARTRVATPFLWRSDARRLSEWHRCLSLLLLALCAVLTGPAQAQSTLAVPDSGFETPALSGSNAYQYAPAGSPWTFANGGGIVGNGSGFNNPDAPELYQAAFLQGSGAVSQPVSGFQAATTYTLTVSAAQRNYNGDPGGVSHQTVQVTLDGVALGTITPTGTAYADYSLNFTTSAGSHTLAFQGAPADVKDDTAFLDNVRIAGAPAESPYNGPHVLPGTVQCEDYDQGGEGVAYHDTDAGNTGGAYRSDDVDIQACGDAGGGYNVGWTAAGEWLRYTVQVQSAGAYTVGFRVASPGGGGSLHLEDETGANVTGAVPVPATGDWQAYTTVTATATLSAGTHVLRLYEDAAGYNLNWVSFAAAGLAAPTGLTATAGSGQVALSWSGVGGATSYNVYRSTAAGAEGSTPYAVGLSGTSYVDTAVSAGTTYYYVVTAVGPGGEGGRSNEASAAPQAPAAPVNGSAFTSQSVPSAMTAGQTYPVAVTMRNTGTTTWTGAGNYHLGSQSPQDNSTWGLGRVPLPASVAPGQSATFPFTVTAPTAPGTYPFQWRLVQDGVEWFGDFTPSVTVTVTAGTGGGGSSVNPQIAPGGSGDLSATGTHANNNAWAVYDPGGSLIADQGQPTPGQGGWQVNMHASGGPNIQPFISAITVSVPAAAAPGVGYTVVVGGPGTNDAAQFDVIAGALPAPTGLTATQAPGGGQSVLLGWSAVAGATSYNVYRSSASSSYGPYGCGTLYQSGVTGTSFTDPAAPAGSTYFYNVYAVHAAGFGTQSNLASVTPYGFVITPGPAALTISRGTVGAVGVTVTPGGGFTGSVALGWSGLPSGVSGLFYPGPTVNLSAVGRPGGEYANPVPEGIYGAASTNLVIAVPASAQPGTYQLQITGTATGATGSATVALTVN